MRQVHLKLIVVVIGIFCLFAQTARADLFIDVTGTSAKGTPVSFSAQLSIDYSISRGNDVLTIVLINNSVKSLHPDDCLSGFYFDILNEDSQRPTLTYFNADGTVYLTNQSGTDLPNGVTDIMVGEVPDDGWKYKVMNPDYFPELGFAVGTAGYSSLSPNDIGAGVDGLNYSIYAGDATTANLHDKLLVKDRVTFEFDIEHLSDYTFTENDISYIVMFGLGTTPDSYIKTPLPGAVLLGILGLGAVGIKLRKYA